MDTPPTEAGGGRRLLWFFGLWAGGVLAVGFAAAVLRWVFGLMFAN